jgi:hypothetical protein
MVNDFWNVSIVTKNGLSREIMFRGSKEDVIKVREYLANNVNISEYDVNYEYADFDANDVIEEVAAWADFD